MSDTGPMVLWLLYKYRFAGVEIALCFPDDKGILSFSGIQEVAGRILRSDNILSLRLVMKSFLWPLSLYR